jgi:hypothetical protein
MAEADYSSTYYGGFSELDLVVWRFVRDQGGYWTAPEIIDQLPTAGTPHVAAGRLKRLFTAGHLARREVRPGNPIRYGVTTSCRAPLRESMTPGPIAPASIHFNQPTAGA